MAETGFIHIYCGDGKGKTTAAMGLALRAAGHGLPVVIAQFLKDGTSGECRILRDLPNINVLAANPCGKFSFEMNDLEREETRDSLSRLFHKALSCAHSPGLLVLDEIFGALSCGFLDEKAVLDFLNAKPDALEIVMTGRTPSAAICETADYISEITKRRHPYDKGVLSREGVEK